MTRHNIIATKTALDASTSPEGVIAPIYATAVSTLRPLLHALEPDKGIPHLVRKPAHKVFVVYHGHCMDGLGAAWSMKRHMVGTPYEDGDQVTEFISATYAPNGGPILGDLERFRDGIVIFVDFCVGINELVQLADRATRVVVADHHANAMETLVNPATVWPESESSKGTPQHRPGKPPLNIHICYNNKVSGAYLSYCVGALLFRPVSWEQSPLTREDIPLPIQMISARDLWDFTDPRVKPFHAYLGSIPVRTIEQLDEVMWQRKETYDHMIGKGFDALRIFMIQVDEHVKGLQIREWAPGIEFAYGNVGYGHASDVGNAALIANPGISFTMTFNEVQIDEKTCKRIYSLRSRAGGTDVSALARLFGGNGHVCAAGFSVVMPSYVPADPRTAPADTHG